MGRARKEGHLPAMQTNLVTFFAAAITALSAAGCSTTVRNLSATAWIAPPGSPGGSGPSGQAPGAPAASAPAPGGGVESLYYVTYWEGNCKAYLGCGRGDTHVKRCKVNPDNSVACVEEANATKAMNPD